MRYIISKTIRVFIVAVICFTSVDAYSQTSTIYNIKLNSIDTDTINLNSFQGKKLLVVVFDAANPDKFLLKSLDSLYKNNRSTFNVLAIPANNFGVNISETQLKKLILDTLKISYSVTKVDKVKKSDLVNQNALLAYLTSKNSNSHFDDDVLKSGEMFLINEKGKLFTRLKETVAVNSTFLNKQIQKQID